MTTPVKPLKAILEEFEPERELQPTGLDFATMDDAMRNRCRHCGMWRKEHVNDKCLFDATTFEPRTWKMELDDMQKEISNLTVERKRVERRRGRVLRGAKSEKINWDEFRRK